MVTNPYIQGLHIPLCLKNKRFNNKGTPVFLGNLSTSAYNYTLTPSVPLTLGALLMLLFGPKLINMLRFFVSSRL